MQSWPLLPPPMWLAVAFFSPAFSTIEAINLVSMLGAFKTEEITGPAAPVISGSPAFTRDWQKNANGVARSVRWTGVLTRPFSALMATLCYFIVAALHRVTR